MENIAGKGAGAPRNGSLVQGFNAGQRQKLLLQLAVAPPSSFGFLRGQGAAICYGGAELEVAEAGFA